MGDFASYMDAASVDLEAEASNVEWNMLIRVSRASSKGCPLSTIT